MEVAAENEIIEQVQKETKDENITCTEIRDPYGFIYITTNLQNGKRYLGQRKFSKGWQKYLGSGSVFRKALNKAKENGHIDNFRRDIIAICYSKNELNQMEYDLSTFLDVVESESWYNLVFGGGATCGWKHTDEAKKKMSDNHYDCNGDKNPNYNNHKLAGENNPFYGRQHTAETKEKISKANKNPSDETRKKMSESARGKVLSQETRDKISAAESGEKHWNYGQKMKDSVKEALAAARREKCSGIQNCNAHHVYCINYDQIFGTISEASKETDVDRNGISACCQGKYKSAGKDKSTGEKLRWLYIEDAISLEYVTQKQLEKYLNQKEIDT